MTELVVNPQQEEREAIARIALTPDGLLQHRYLRRILESCRATEIDGALSRHEGARILARDLMAIMAEGIESNRAGSSTDQPLVTRSAGPVAVARTSGTRRRGADAPGWGPEPDTGSPGVGAGPVLGRKGRRQRR